MDLVAVTSLKQFFKTLLDEALGQTGLDVAEVTEFYLANLLAEFAAADRLFAPDEPGGAAEPLALLYHRAQSAERDERIRILRRLGDVSLYKAGFFAGALRDSVVGQGYTIDMGRAAYSQVAVLARGGFAQVYDELGRKFRPLVDVLQDQLEAIYDIECPRASDFLLHPEQAELLRRPRADEELWVHEGEEGLEVGLYYSPGLRSRLADRSLRDPAWLAPGLDAYCRLAEGVSHFLYLARAAALGRTLSMLELEVQAEVDKFASLVLHHWPSLQGAAGARLHARLFRDVSYRPGLAPEE